MTPLNHIVQTHSGCASACLAMILHESYEKVYGEFHARYWEGQLTSAEYLRSKGLEVITPAVADHHVLYAGAIHMVAVPSLSGIGGHHNIVVDTRFKDPIILDPAKGFNNSRYYVMPQSNVLDKGFSDVYDPLAFPLVSWFNELVIVCE